VFQYDDALNSVPYVNEIHMSTSNYGNYEFITNPVEICQDLSIGGSIKHLNNTYLLPSYGYQLSTFKPYVKIHGSVGYDTNSVNLNGSVYVVSTIGDNSGHIFNTELDGASWFSSVVSNNICYGTKMLKDGKVRIKYTSDVNVIDNTILYLQFGLLVGIIYKDERRIAINGRNSIYIDFDVITDVVIGNEIKLMIKLPNNEIGQQIHVNSQMVIEVVC
jgi:hypothetical protein